MVSRRRRGLDPVGPHREGGRLAERGRGKRATRLQRPLRPDRGQKGGVEAPKLRQQRPGNPRRRGQPAQDLLRGTLVAGFQPREIALPHARGAAELRLAHVRVVAQKQHDQPQDLRVLSLRRHRSASSP
jgi:hypothetical protein